MIKRIILIILCAVNMVTITYFSTQNAEKSTKVSEGVTTKIVSTVTNKPQAEVKDNVKQYDKYTRSFAHFTLFLLLGVLLYITLKTFNVKMPFLYAFAICFVYALFDETYQELLNQGRAFQLVDLLKDWIGSFSGIVITYLICKSIKYVKKAKEIK